MPVLVLGWTGSLEYLNFDRHLKMANNKPTKGALVAVRFGSSEFFGGTVSKFAKSKKNETGNLPFLTIPHGKERVRIKKRID